MKTPPRTINIDQLYTQDAFLSFCNDYHSSRYNQKLGVKITAEFLSACEKDKFILPIHIQKEAVILRPLCSFQDAKEWGVGDLLLTNFKAILTNLK